MPEGYTHVRTAKKAAAAIHYKVQCPAAFAAGANGPDSFFCYEIWKPAAKRSYDLPALGSRMHEENTGAFLQALIRGVHTRAQIEYVLGFLSHYAADIVMHPYVVYVSSPGQIYGMKGGHGYFEIALDSTLHAEDTGVSQVPAQDTSPVPAGEELADMAALLHTALVEAYGEEVPVEALADSFYYTNRIRRLFTSRHGVRKVVFGVVERLFGGKGFITGHISPAHLRLDLPEDWTDPATGEERHSGAFALLKDARQRSELFMAAALGYWMKEVSWETLVQTLGSMSYTTGTETERSKPVDAVQEQTESDSAL